MPPPPLDGANNVRALIDLGAHVNARDTSGRTPLMWAASYGQEEIVSYLLHKGANSSLTTGLGRACLPSSLQMREDRHKRIANMIEKGHVTKGVRVRKDCLLKLPGARKRYCGGGGFDCSGGVFGGEWLLPCRQILIWVKILFQV